jgi:alpha-galactosidase
MSARRPGSPAVCLIALTLLFALPAAALSQLSSFDPVTKTFRLEGGDVSYVFGVNEHDELQSIYWGSRLQPGDSLAQATSNPGRSSFESGYSETQQEYAGWGQGLQWEPALKITFPDGNRDLVFHYLSHRLTNDGVDVTLARISHKGDVD